MLKSSKTSKQFFALFTAAAVATAANIVSNDAERTAEASEPTIEAPEPVTGIQAPVVGQLASLEDVRLEVPKLRAPALSAPAIPDLELVVWGVEGVIAAPSAVIEVDAPEVGTLPSLEDLTIRGHGLVEPALPAIGS